MLALNLIGVQLSNLILYNSCLVIACKTCFPQIHTFLTCLKLMLCKSFTKLLKEYHLKTQKYKETIGVKLMFINKYRNLFCHSQTCGSTSWLANPFNSFCPLLPNLHDKLALSSLSLDQPSTLPKNLFPFKTSKFQLKIPRNAFCSPQELNTT